MSIIIISADTGEIEEIIAQKVAETMGFTTLDHHILAEVASTHGIDPDQLDEALKTTPSLFKKMTAKQWRYALSCLEAEVLDRLLKDNIVCHGVAAHLYVTGVSHAMKVRILKGKNRVIKEIVQQRGLSLEKTERCCAAELEQRKKWSKAAYGFDETDLSQYDLVINLDQIDPEEAVKTIAGAAEYRKFQVMTYSMKCLSDLALSARVNTVLLNAMTDISVQSHDGSVVVTAKASNRQKRERIALIKEMAGKVDGVRYVEVHVK